MSSAGSLLLVAGLSIVLAHSCSRSHAPELAPEHRQAISAAFTAHGSPVPTSIEIDSSGFLAASFELPSRPSENALSPVAEERVMTLRNAMEPFHLIQSYRVSFNGPSPGSDILRRYGSARYIEGERVIWEPGIP